MAKLSDPQTVMCEVTIRTPLVGQYHRRLVELYGDPGHGLDDGILKSFHVAEPEFGRGVVLVLRSGLQMAPRRAAKIVARVEALFDERERAALAREDEISREAVRDDAEAGI